MGTCFERKTPAPPRAGRPWTKKDFARLLGAWGRKDREELAAELGRTVEACRRKLRNELGRERTGYLSISSIAAETGWPWYAIRDAARDMGLKLCRHGAHYALSEEQRDQILEYLDGLTTATAVAKRLGVGLNLVWRVARELDLRTRARTLTRDEAEELEAEIRSRYILEPGRPARPRSSKRGRRREDIEARTASADEATLREVEGE